MQLHTVGTGRAEHFAARLLVANLAVAFATALPARSYGPDNCVSITRADGGTCQISTNCATQDLSSFDFAFLCVTQPAGQELHSLGVGSFDQVEEFDTDVHCDQCLPPAVPHAAKPVMQASLNATGTRGVTKPKMHVPARSAGPLAHKERGRVPVRRVATHMVHPAKKSTATTPVKLASKNTSVRAKLMVPVSAASSASSARSSHKAPNSVQEGTALLEKEEPSSERSESPDDSGDDVPAQAEHYGPASCVSVWRNVSTGSCVMQTECDQPSSLSIYEFGLVCVDEANKMTKHVFGMDSFKSKERFDTLIECKECRALDEYMNGDKALKQLTQQVQEMEGDLESVSKGVTRLNAEVMEEKKKEAADATVKTRQNKDAAEEKEEEQADSDEKKEEGAAEEKEEETANSDEKKEEGAAETNENKAGEDQEAKEQTQTVNFLRHTPVDSHDVRYAEEGEEKEEGEKGEEGEEGEEEAFPAAEMEEGEDAEEDVAEMPAAEGDVDEQAPLDVPAIYSEEAEEVQQEAVPAAEGEEKEEVKEEASPAKVGFLRQARHRHPHQQYKVRRVHRHHLEVRQQESANQKPDEAD